MNNKSQKKYLIGSLIFLLVVSGIFAFLYVQIKNNNIASEEAEIEWNSEISKLNNIKVLNLSIRDIEKEKALFESHFVKNSDIVSFLDTLEGYAKDVSVNASISAVDTLPDDAGLVIGIRTFGTFESLYKFLMLLENSKYEMNVVEFDIQKDGASTLDGTEQVPQWSASFKIQLLAFMK